MTVTDNEAVVRHAFEALEHGDIDAMLESVDPDLEWTFLDRSQEDPEPAVCHGRDQLGYWARRRPAPRLAELVGYGDRVLVITHVPERDEPNFHVVTVRAGRITALRACRSREEAVGIASTEPGPRSHPAQPS
jgi:ketosteroid isomerase-like protein